MSDKHHLLFDWWKVPFQGPSPGNCCSLDSASEKAGQKVTPSPESVKSTPKGYLNCTPSFQQTHSLSGFLSPLPVFLVFLSGDWKATASADTH